MGKNALLALRLSLQTEYRALFSGWLSCVRRVCPTGRRQSFLRLVVSILHFSMKFIQSTVRS